MALGYSDRFVGAPGLGGRTMRHPLIALAVGRPALVLGVAAAAICTLLVLAYRGAPPASIAADFAGPIAFLLAMTPALGLAALLPVPSGRLATGAAMLLAGVAWWLAPSLVAFAPASLPASFPGLMRTAIFVAAAMLLPGPFVRAEGGHLILALAAATVGIASGIGLQEIGRTSLSGASGDLALRSIAAGGAGGVLLASFFASRFAAAVALGEDGGAASATALRASSPYGAFISAVVISILILLQLRDGAMTDWQGAALAIGAGVLAPTLCVLVLGGAAFALAPGGDRMTFAANARELAAKDAVRRLRTRASPSTSLAVLAVASIVAIVAVIDTAGGPNPYGLLAAIVAAAAAGTCFVSLRAGISLGAMLTILACVAPWAFGLFLGRPSDLEAAAAIALTAALVAPTFLFWREGRNPWRKAREVALRGVEATLGGAIVAAIMLAGWCATVWFAGIWPAVGGIATWTACCAAMATLLTPFWLVGFGAIIGRGE